MPDVGDSRTATLTVSPFDGSTAATLLVTAPDSTTSTPATTGSGGGATWTATVPYTQAGWWLLKWTVTGTGAGIEYQQVNVTGVPATPAQPLVASLEDFKLWLRITATHTADDAKLLDVLASATEWVEWRIGGPLAVASYTNRLKCNGWLIVPQKRPLVSVTSITPDLGTALSSAWYTVDTTTNTVRLYWGIRPCWLTIVYTAGLSAIPRRIKNAGLELARHLWLTQNGSVGRGRSDDDIPVPMGFAVPRRVEEMLGTVPSGMGFA